MALTIALNATSFIVIAQAESETMAIAGVVMTSLALGIGEVTLLSYSAKFNKCVCLFMNCVCSAFRCHLNDEFNLLSLSLSLPFYFPPADE